MQQDLFHYANQNNESTEFFSKQVRKDPGGVTLRFEQVLIGLIGLLVLYAFVYSWGFEKGRNQANDYRGARETVLERESRFHEVAKRVEAIRESAKAQGYSGEHRVDSEKLVKIPEQDQISTQVESLIEKVIEKESKAPEGRFTIQHVTYLRKDQAQEEIKKLSKMGYAPFLVPSGKYLQICINGFESKSDAVKVLKQLKNDGVVALDAYIRNMPKMA